MDDIHHFKLIVIKIPDFLWPN